MRWLAGALMAGALLPAACSSDDADDRPAAPAAARACQQEGARADGRYPDSIALLGHSWGTGESSDPKLPPHTEVRANSWATGTNPAVDSVYRRILRRNPAIERCNFNLAEGGATVDDLGRQARRAASLRPKPELTLIQIMDNDIVCPARASDYASFRAGLRSALRTLIRGAPESKIFVVSQFGSPTTTERALHGPERALLAGPGPCDYIDTDGTLVDSKLRRIERTVHGYEAQLEAACRTVEHCTYDGGAFGQIVDRREYLAANDLNHPSVEGHAKQAAVAWSVMRRAGVLPRSD